jgi:hypothetical protein
VTTPGRGASAVPVALLTTNDPLLVERSYHGGRVLLSTVPLDNSGRTNLTDLPAFAPLAHELIYYLAGARSAEYNLQPGQPLRYHPENEPTPQAVRLHPPEGPARSLIAERWPLVVEETREAGVYRLERSNGQTVPYVVQADPRESDLTPCGDADRQKVAEIVPVTYREFRERLVADATDAPPARELWWWFLFGVVGLLCAEVALTRRLAVSRGT